MIEIFIDGQRVEADDKHTVMQAARASGHEIPAFCWHPQLSVPGNCRVCMVEIEGDGPAAGWLDIACNMPVAKGMRVLTDSPRVRTRRKQMLELVTLNHPVDCGICDKAGECTLQDYHYEYNGAASVSRSCRSSSGRCASMSSPGRLRPPVWGSRCTTRAGPSTPPPPSPSSTLRCPTSASASTTSCPGGDRSWESGSCRGSVRSTRPLSSATGTWRMPCRDIARAASCAGVAPASPNRTTATDRHEVVP